MEQPAATGTDRASRPRDEIADPRRGSRSELSLIVFGLLLTATLLIDGFTDASPSPGIALVAAGLMFSAGVADLLDPAARRLVIGVRGGGLVMTLLGLLVQFFG